MVRRWRRLQVLSFSLRWGYLVLKVFFTRLTNFVASDNEKVPKGEPELLKCQSCTGALDSLKGSAAVITSKSSSLRSSPTKSALCCMLGVWRSLDEQLWLCSWVIAVSARTKV